MWKKAMGGRNVAMYFQTRCGEEVLINRHGFEKTQWSGARVKGK